MADKLALSEPPRGGASDEVNPFEQCTNLDVFREYVGSYLRLRPDIHKEDMILLVRQFAPGPQGLPLEIYGFTMTTDWARYETIQAEIFSHLVAVVPLFDLRLFQGSRQSGGPAPSPVRR